MTDDVNLTMPALGNLYGAASVTRLSYDTIRLTMYVKNLVSRHGSHLPIQSVNMFKQGETDMADKGKKDKGKKEQQKKAKLNLKDKRKQKKEKQTRGTF